MELTHSRLTDIAINWLQRPRSRSGPGCSVAISEPRSGYNGEAPDAIGWRVTGCPFSDGTTVVEVKVSRSDFLADKHKPHRNGAEMGLGNWRYYMAPQGLITPDDLPAHWGLLEVSPRGAVKVMAGPAGETHYGRHQQALIDHRFDANVQREQFILVKLLARVGDPEKLNRMLRKASNEAQRLARQHEKARSDVRAYSECLWKANHMLSIIAEDKPDVLQDLETRSGYSRADLRPANATRRRRNASC